MLNHSRAETFFANQEGRLLIVRDYLLNSEFDSLSIRWPPTTIGGMPIDTDEILMSTGSGYGHVPVDDDAVIEALHHLFSYVRSIGMRGNSISFLLWSTIDHGRGIAFSIDGNTPDESGLAFLTEIEPLFEKGWYFYVENFNEWRRQR